MIRRYSPTQSKEISASIHSRQSWIQSLATRRRRRLEIRTVPKVINHKDILTSYFPPPINDREELFQFEEAGAAGWGGGFADLAGIYI